jgi:hypothetical protein
MSRLRVALIIWNLYHYPVLKGHGFCRAAAGLENRGP